jgi:acetolactate synthase-1/2/3 large subunit
VVSGDIEQHARVIADSIAGRRLAIWVGFGARGAAAEIRELATRTDAVVMASPRGKGVFSEQHPRYLGVTGFGGHDFAARYRAFAPEALLVLGTRLGEMTSFWDARLVPPAGLIHVDVDDSAFGTAFPDVPVRGVRAEIRALCEALVHRLPAAGSHVVPPPPAVEEPPAPRPGPVRPSMLMRAIQHVIVDGSDATVLTEAGNAFAWTTHLLRFDTPGRYRVSTGFGAMGMATAGVVGVAHATNRRAVAVVGDGAMLMHQEVSTAVAHRVPTIWIVLNDGRYGMIEQGMRALGWTPFAVELGSHDFVALARAVGADGVRVETEVELDAALRRAIAAPGPFVVDVRTDPSETAPFGMRNQNLSRAIATNATENCA